MNLNNNIKSTLKIGWLNYWNLLPFRIELENEMKNFLYSLNLEQTPKKINEKIVNASYDMAPCSSILLNQKGIKLAAPIGVACNGNVSSVYLASSHKQPHLLHFIEHRSEQLYKCYQKYISCKPAEKFHVYLDKNMPAPLFTVKKPKVNFGKASSTSATMTKILWKIFWGPQIQEESSENELTLIIGNEALKKYNLFPTKIDLGQLWKKCFNLPFVYACLLTHENMKITPIIKKALQNSAIKAQNKMKIEPTFYSQKAKAVNTLNQDIDLKNYWDKIYYILKEDELRSLELFLSLSKKYLKPCYPEIKKPSLIKTHLNT